MSVPPDETRQWLAQNWSVAGRFVRDVTHDVNNQLGAVLAYAELLALEVEGRADVREMVDEIVRAVQRASLLVDTLASLPSEDVESVLSVDLAAVLRESLVLFEREADRGRVRLSIAMPDGEAMINGVHTRLSRLVIHAMRYAFDRIAEASAPGNLNVELSHDDDTYTLRLASRAIGVSSDLLDEASQHAAHHGGSLSVEPGQIVVTIPRETGLIPSPAG